MTWWKTATDVIKCSIFGPEGIYTNIDKEKRGVPNPKTYEEAKESMVQKMVEVGLKNPKQYIAPKDPEPDLSTKPADKIGYCFGYVCPKKHVNSTFESITVDGYKERRVCQECGAVTRPATVRRTAEAVWVDRGNSFWGDYKGIPYKPSWGWRQSYDFKPLWNRFEFIQFLDEPKPRKTVRRKK